MNQPIDYVLDADARLITCHCRHGFICPNTMRAVDLHNRCRILVRKSPRRVTLPAMAAFVLLGAGFAAILVGLIRLLT